MNVKHADDFAKQAITVRDNLADIKQAVSAVESGEHYFGPMFGQDKSKILPGVQEAIGSKFGDQTAMNNTTLMRALTTRNGLQGIKDSMGPSISNFDVQSWLKSNPVNEKSSPEQLKQYFTKLHNQLWDMAQRDKANAVQYGKLSPNFNFGDRLPDFRTSTSRQEKKKERDNQVDTTNPLLR